MIHTTKTSTLAPTPIPTVPPPSSPTRVEYLLPTETSIAASATVTQTGAGSDYIAFVFQKPPEWFHVYLLDLAEDKAIPLTQGDLSYTYPLWSPDGKRLLVQSAPPGSPVVVDIWVMAADGSGLLNLTTDLSGGFTPDWSPDGERIAFASRFDGNYEIYVARVDGSERVRLTNDPALDLDPSWSPDGDKLAFTSDRHSGDTQVYLMNADGSGIMRLTDTAGEARRPQWSPDGREMAFLLDDALWLMNADGSNQHKVSGTVQVFSFLAPRWSPDGRRVLFAGRKPAELHDNVFYVDVEDQAPVRVTDNTQDYVSGSWSPDGGRVAVIAIPRSGSYHLYSIDLATSSIVLLTDTLGLDCCAEWRPYPGEE